MLHDVYNIIIVLSDQSEFIGAAEEMTHMAGQILIPPKLLTEKTRTPPRLYECFFFCEGSE